MTAINAVTDYALEGDVGVITLNSPPVNALSAAVRDGLATVAVGTAQLTALAEGLPDDRHEVYVCIRAEDVVLLRNGAVQSSARNHLPVTVRGWSSEGPLLRVSLDAGFPLVALLTQSAGKELALQAGAEMVALIKAPQVHLISFTR